MLWRAGSASERCGIRPEGESRCERGERGLRPRLERPKAVRPKRPVSDSEEPSRHREGRPSERSERGSRLGRVVARGCSAVPGDLLSDRRKRSRSLEVAARGVSEANEQERLPGDFHCCAIPVAVAATELHSQQPEDIHSPFRRGVDTESGNQELSNHRSKLTEDLRSYTDPNRTKPTIVKKIARQHRVTPS